MSTAAFGTAGIRAPLGEGPDRMNPLTVRRVAVGVAPRVLAEVPGAAERGVVVARDARHGSAELSAEVVDVLRRHGLRVHLFDEPTPTPLGVFAVRRLGAAAGVIVTASHNPPGDNGVKVVWQDGAQVVPPTDGAIAAEAASVPYGAPLRVDPSVRPGRIEHLGGPEGDHPVVRAYLDHAAALLSAPGSAPVRVAATALHGVGAGLLDRVLRGAGHQVHHVEHQRTADPDFPTVPVPNPEEPGVLDAVLEQAAASGAEVALALDPDADRLAVAVPEGGRWRVLTGDEVGVVLLAHLLERSTGVPHRLVATTVVSSRLAGRMCAAAGVHFRETPTGFKWLCRPGIDHPGWHQLLLYEEALGYAVGHGVRDKDGITAALVLLEALAAQRDRGRSLLAVLDDLAREHGRVETLNGSIQLAPTEAATALGRLELLEQGEVTELAGLAVVSADRPAPSTVRVLLEDDTRVLVRPSGTEPKLKYYLEAFDAPPPAGARLSVVLAALRDILGC